MKAQVKMPYLTNKHIGLSIHFNARNQNPIGGADMKKIIYLSLFLMIITFSANGAWAFDCAKKPNAKLCRAIEKYVSRVQSAAEDILVGPLRNARIDKAYTDMDLTLAEYVLCMETENTLQHRIDSLAVLAKGAVRVDAASFAKMYRAAQRLVAMCY